MGADGPPRHAGRVWLSAVIMLAVLVGVLLIMSSVIAPMAGAGGGCGGG
jgi:hypothetical protein